MDKNTENLDKKGCISIIEMNKRIQAIEERLEDHEKRIRVLELQKAI